MSKSIYKLFVVMVSVFFTVIFLVSTTISPSLFAAESDLAVISLVDNSSTKNLSTCINNQFVAFSSGKYSLPAGKQEIKVFYGDIEAGIGCNNQYIQFKKVFESSLDLKSGESYTITVTGKADLTGVIKHNKAVLVTQTELPNIKQSSSVISWKSVADAEVKNKNAICVNQKVLKEDNAGSKQISVDPGYYKVSFDYDQSGDLCNPILPESEGHSLILDIGCSCNAKYEINAKKDDDYAKAKYQGLNFATSTVTKQLEAVIPPVKPIPVVGKPDVPDLPVKPVPTTNPPPVVAKPAPVPTATVRSGGGDILVSIVSLGSIFVVSVLYITKKKSLKWS
jgi:hypothetical protein